MNQTQKEERARGFAEITRQANTAGMVAGRAANPAPMFVQGLNSLYRVPDGPCGFAWVQTKGNTSFGRWAKTNGWGRGYPSGLQLWVGEFGQSLGRKEAYARAYAQVLLEAGIEASAGSRMD